MRRILAVLLAFAVGLVLPAVHAVAVGAPLPTTAAIYGYGATATGFSPTTSHAVTVASATTPTDEQVLRATRDLPRQPIALAAADEGATGGGALVKSTWPANDGFLGTPVETTLKPGTVVDRYGAPSGSYVSPEGTPPSGNVACLPITRTQSPITDTKSSKPSQSAVEQWHPAFGGGGGGVQYQFGTSIEDLVDRGVLKQVPGP